MQLLEHAFYSVPAMTFAGLLATATMLGGAACVLAASTTLGSLRTICRSDGNS